MNNPLNDLIVHADRDRLTLLRAQGPEVWMLTRIPWSGTAALCVLDGLLRAVDAERVLVSIAADTPNAAGLVAILERYGHPLVRLPDLAQIENAERSFAHLPRPTPVQPTDLRGNLLRAASTPPDLPVATPARLTNSSFLSPSYAPLDEPDRIPLDD